MSRAWMIALMLGSYVFGSFMWANTVGHGNAERAYARGYAACRDSCARAGSSLHLTPGARVATIMDRMGMRYTFMVDNGEQVHINSAGVDYRGEVVR